VANKMVRDVLNINIVKQIHWAIFHFESSSILFYTHHISLVVL
jgi:hypothetical protein